MLRTLIADDSSLLTERLVAELDKVEGVEVIAQVGTANEATASIRELKPDVVILDLCMPGGSGIEVLDEIKRDPLPPIVIVLTGFGEPQYRKRCLASGASFFFDKTTEFEQVRETMQNLVRREHSAEAEAAAPVQPLPPDVTPTAAAQPVLVRRPLAEKPKLLVSRSSKGEPIYYLCSCCLEGFQLSDKQPPIDAVRELCARFREHVENMHPDGVHRSS